MATRHYIIYADESDKRGRYFSNFFGGVLLNASDRQAISEALQKKKDDLGLNHEVKWQYVDASCVDRYTQFVHLYFEFVSTSRLKTRIMFTQNMMVPNNLERRHHEEQYFLLYYQFIKHAFGIAHCNPNALDRVYFSILPDKIPESAENLERFKSYLSRIPDSSLMRGRNLHIRKSDIADVDSEKHVILQGLDLILGSINSRLNDKFKEKPAGARVRGKRTRAKEKLYKEINRQIREIYPNFNVGVSTGMPNGISDRWSHPYRHWRFTASGYILDRSLGKRAK
tara:strand:+ start:310 stop:1158 length:849 start_codon:yes stop_codon:yes gene_type:complete